MNKKNYPDLDSEQFLKKIYWETYFIDTSMINYYCENFSERIFKEELISVVLHPDRVIRYIKEFNYMLGFDTEFTQKI